MGHPAAASTKTLPLVLWPVDGASIRMNLEWDGSPQSQRYMQVNDQSGANSQIKLDDDELIYIRLNPRTHTPFGLGPLEGLRRWEHVRLHPLTYLEDGLELIVKDVGGLMRPGSSFGVST